MKRRLDGFTARDAPLRDDVRRLGALVGDVIREQGGKDLFDAVEKARRAAIRRRPAHTAARSCRSTPSGTPGPR